MAAAASAAAHAAAVIAHMVATFNYSMVYGPTFGCGGFNFGTPMEQLEKNFEQEQQEKGRKRCEEEVALPTQKTPILFLNSDFCFPQMEELSHSNAGMQIGRLIRILKTSAAQTVLLCGREVNEGTWKRVAGKFASVFGEAGLELPIDAIHAYEPASIQAWLESHAHLVKQDLWVVIDYDHIQHDPENFLWITDRSRGLDVETSNAAIYSLTRKM